MDFYNATILTVNAISILFILGLTALLICVVKLHKTNVYGTLLISTTTLPIYIYNVCFIMGYMDAAMCVAPFAYSCFTLFFPLLWFYVYKSFNPNFKFNIVRLLHFFPTITCFLIYTLYLISLTDSDRINFLVNSSTYMSNWIEYINIAVIFTQMIVYYSIIFIYLYYTRQFINKNFSEVEWNYNLWIPRLMFLLMFAATILIWGNKMDLEIHLWLVGIVNFIAFFYFAYHIVSSPNLPRPPRPISIVEFQYEATTKRQTQLDDEQMKKQADIIMEYLTLTEAYLNPILTLRNVADATGIEYVTIPQTLRTTMQCSFFDLINNLRVSKAKKLLIADDKGVYDIDKITTTCGFNSRASFYNAFKNSEGKTFPQWVKSVKEAQQDT